MTGVVTRSRLIGLPVQLQLGATGLSRPLITSQDPSRLGLTKSFPGDAQLLLAGDEIRLSRWCLELGSRHVRLALRLIVVASHL